MNDTTDTSVELAWRTPGFGWKRRTFRTEAAAARFAEKLDDDVEVRWAD